MSAYRLCSTVVWKTLKGQVGLLNTETAQFYLLDTVASDVFRLIMDDNQPLESIQNEEAAEILDSLIDIGFLEKVSYDTGSEIT